MMRAFFNWIARRPGRFWLSAGALSILLVVLQLFIPGPAGKAFGLAAYPNWNPVSWLGLFAVVFLVFPLLAAGVVLVPLGALLLSLIARLWRST